jgi:hypothetical protein
MLIGSYGARMCRYLGGVLPHRAFHVTGMGFSRCSPTATRILPALAPLAE